ncbi:MAG: polysaccharide pyruvyl transferase family protein [Nitrospira sp.]|nr:polysaccharide pyruvyl transferase family protein [Nitrospira sp.]
MKIATITCHDVYNYGASLQAYALMHYLEGRGHQAEIIDYKPDYLSGHYQLLAAESPLVGNSRVKVVLYVLAKLPGRLLSRRRKWAFDRFRDSHLKLTATRYGSFAELRDNPPQADCFIAGSDQIWNTLRPNGKDPAFYLMFAPAGAIRASYAASIATDVVADSDQPLMRDGVSALDHVSVRESTAVELLAQMGIGNISHVLDPVFLLSKESWNRIGPDRHDDGYVLVYDFDASDEVERIATELAQARGLRIYSISQGRYDYADRKFPHAGPAEFVSLIRDAQVVVTNSYHAIVFSLIFGVDFYTAGRTENINSRMSDLLVQFGLEMSSLIDMRETKERVSVILEARLRKSEQYLSEVLAQ